MRVLTIDLEHSFGPLRPWEEGFYLTCVGMVDNKGWSKVWWFDHKSTEDNKPDFKKQMEEIQDELDDADLVVAQNLKHDASILSCYGVQLDSQRTHCTMVTEFLLAGQSRRRSYALAALCEHYDLDAKLDVVASYWNNGIDTYHVPAHLVEEYVLDDCAKTLAICESQKPIVDRMGMANLVGLHNEFTHSLIEMETNGFAFDTERAKEIHDEYKGYCRDVEQKIRDLVGEPKLNVDSTSQLASICFGGELKLKWYEWTVVTYKTKPYSRYYEKEQTEVKKRRAIWASDKRSTEKKRLAKLPTRTKLQKELKKLLIRYSEVKKVANTLLNKTGDKGLITKVQTDGRVHPSLNQTIARTGRLTSSNPNGQNLPRDGTSPIKETIIPTLDGILQWDLSQIEWRTAAFLSQDKNMIREIVNDVDQHIQACVEWMELPFISKQDDESKANRTSAKVFNFRMIYGGVAYGFYMDVNMPDFSLPKWERIERMFYEQYWGLERWQKKTIRYATLNGNLQLPNGRVFNFFKEKMVRGVLEYNERQMKNYPVQGLAGDILFLACVVIRRAMKKKGCKSKMILTVHDSIVFDYVEDELKWLVKLCETICDNLPQYIENYFGFEWNVPLAGECEAGPNYGKLKEVEYD